MKKPALALLLLGLGWTAAAFADDPAAPAGPGLFRDGDRWGAVGDSITQSGSYYAWVYLYYATRFPERRLEVFNGGVAGDSAHKAGLRYGWDLRPRRATVATVMLGMNDVQRNLYATPATPEIERTRRAALDGYRISLAALAARLRADGARLIFVTPSPFDETADLASPRLEGVNGALGECAKIMRALAADNGDAVIDLHGPMTRLNRDLQAKDPTATAIGPDRTHPQVPGHLALAYYFLKAQGAPAFVSAVEIDAASARVAAATNARVEDLQVSEAEVAFTLHANALPFPVPAEAGPALAWVPFQDELNREMLQVRGLATGDYRLSIDGAAIRSFSSAELAHGVNLALESTTPQARQAAQVAARVRSWQTKVSLEDRAVANVEQRFLRELARPIDFGSAKALLEARLAATPPPSESDQRVIRRYLAVKPVEAGLRTTLLGLEKAIREAAQPRPHAYRLTRQ